MRTCLTAGISATVLLALLWGCSENPATVEITGADSPVHENFITPAMAREIATATVVNNIDDEHWTSASRITDINPLFIDGIETVGYWECKVVDDGEDAGYVLVTANKADVLVPELSQSGGTLTETYREMTGKDDITIYRYDWFRSTACTAVPKGNRTAAASRPLATIGFDGISGNGNLAKSTGEDQSAPSLATFTSEYSAKAGVSKCFPGYSPDNVRNYYNELETEAASDNGLAKTAASWRDIKAELSNYCSTPSRSPWHTPQWKQYKKSNGYYIGCGAVAYGIVYGYWDAFKGKSRLFGSSFNARDYTANGYETRSEIKNAIATIASNIGTVDVSDYQGLTWPSRMLDGYRYGRACGYSSTKVTKYNGTEYWKFDKVKNALRSNRPAILLIHSDGIGIVNHYVVIEAARKTQTKYLWNWHDRNVYYTVNYGWGSTRKQICVRDWGANGTKVYTSTSVYDLIVQ